MSKQFWWIKKTISNCVHVPLHHQFLCLWFFSLKNTFQPISQPDVIFIINYNCCNPNFYMKKWYPAEHASTSKNCIFKTIIHNLSWKCLLIILQDIPCKNKDETSSNSIAMSISNFWEQTFAPTPKFHSNWFVARKEDEVGDNAVPKGRPPTTSIPIWIRPKELKSWKAKKLVRQSAKAENLWEKTNVRRSNFTLFQN